MDPYVGQIKVAHLVEETVNVLEHLENLPNFKYYRN